MFQRIKNVFDFLLFTHLYFGVATVAVCYAYHTIWNIATPINSSIYLFIFLSTIAYYSFLRLMAAGIFTLQPDSVPSCPSSSQYDTWVRSHRLKSLCIWGIATVGAVVLFFRLQYIQQLVIAIASILSLLYNLPTFLPANPYSLRQIWFLKPFVVAFVCTLCYGLLPNIDAPFYTLLWVCSSMYLLLAAMLLLFEMKDMEADSYAKIVTIPYQIGIRATKGIALLLLIGNVITCAFAPQFGMLYSIPPVLFIAITYLYIQPTVSAYWYWIVVDGWLLILGLYVFVINLVWVNN